MARRLALAALTAVLAGAAAVLPGVPGALAVQPAQSQVVSAVPQAGTPQIQDGAVYAAAQVGGTMVVGGSFSTTADPSSSTPFATPSLLAFDAVTGVVQTGFRPAVNGVVNALLPGPTAGTVYAGGAFTTAGGAPARGLVLLNVSDGSRVTAFAPAIADGTVQTLKRLSGRLFVGGTFTKVAGVRHAGLATVSATSGALDPYLSSNVAGHHNWTPSSPAGNPKGAVGVFRLDLSPDGTKMVAIGNFTQVDGAGHDQIAMWDLSGTAATVRAWGTSRLQPACFAATYDSYTRDVDFSPDGSWFALANVGGYVEGALCDSVSRWETAATGANVQPTWVDYTGQDSLLSVAVTGTAVYVGGHERWLNNGLAHDTAGPGAVPRPGLAALDPVNGLPLAWNPGRNPRGVGAGLLYATSAGLWVGSDTDSIGNRLYTRAKIAFFPLAGGAAPASKAVASLPGEVYVGSVPAAPATGVLYRVDAGGPVVQSIDAGPDWADDSGATSPLRSAGSTAVAYGSPVPAVDATVPAGTPAAVFSTERVDPGAKGDGGELQWHFPVPAGTSVDVRLSFAARCACAATADSRTFDVSIDGVTRLDHFDAVTAAGVATGTMRHWTVTSDGSVDIAFTHEAGDPAVSALELVQGSGGPWPSPTGTLTGRAFSGTAAGAPQALRSPPLDASAVRGATMVGGQLFYGRTDGNLYRRATDGRTWGHETLVDPYDDPYWSGVKTGSGNLYRGAKPGFYTEIPNLTSMSYDGSSRMYYTLYTSNALYYRDFSPDSGVLSWAEHTVAGVTLPDLTGAFLANGSLYWASRADGTLSRAAFSGSALGSPTVVSGPAQDGIDWRSRVLYLGAVPPADLPPTASFTDSCSSTTCSLDGTGSRDPDGTVTGWAWSYGDGTTGAGATTQHTYAAAGTYQVQLTVTDDEGVTATSSQPVTVRVPASPIVFRGSTGRSDTGSAVRIAVPAGTQPGDALLLRVTTSGTASDPQAPAGWTEAGRQVAGTALTVLWQHVATAQDTPGSLVPVTLATSIKSSTVLLAYGGTAAAPVVAVATAGDAATVTDHVAPAVQVATPGSWVVHLWADKSSGTTAWTLQSGVLRASTYGSGAGYVTSVAADAGVGSPAGSAPAATASTDAASRATGLSVVLAPAA